MEIQDGPEGLDAPVRYLSFCARHAKPQPNQSGAAAQQARERDGGVPAESSTVPAGVGRIEGTAPHLCPLHAGCRVVSESEEQGDLPEALEPPALDNSQPYLLPPRAPLPVCPAGAARAMPIVSWQRQQHGTGTGASSRAAYWIPGQPQGAEPPRGRQRAGGRGGVDSRGSSLLDLTLDATPGDSGPLPGSPARSGWGGSSHGGWRGFDDDEPPVQVRCRAPLGCADDVLRRSDCWAQSDPLVSLAAVLSKVELLPLPVGVPERVPIVCNGCDAALILRTQAGAAGGQRAAAANVTPAALAAAATSRAFHARAAHLSSALLQRVLYDGDEMTATRVGRLCGTRGPGAVWMLHAVTSPLVLPATWVPLPRPKPVVQFESVAGMGQTKKWKQSFFLAGADGEPGEVSARLEVLARASAAAGPPAFYPAPRSPASPSPAGRCTAADDG